jgi:hypothetical protein
LLKNVPLFEPQNEPQYFLFFSAVLGQTLLKEKSLKPLRFQGFLEKSALGELGRAACGFQAVLLAFYENKSFIFNGYRYLFKICTSK